MALETALTVQELLKCPILASSQEPTAKELFNTPTLDLNIAKLLPNVAVSSPTGQPAMADLMVLVASINEFLKLRLDDISTLAPISAEMTTSVHQPHMEFKEKATTAQEELLTDITEENTMDAGTACTCH
uniref:Uncharacterized protein n=1 Tax=Romanomermis culicivorax TaxID=13658 RepID=A0A915IYD1_ROMCU